MIAVLLNIYIYDNTAWLCETIYETIHVVKGYLGANPVKETSLIKKKKKKSM